MIIGAVFGLALVVSVSVDTGVQTFSGSEEMRLPRPQKNAAMRPLVRGATDCIVHAVTTDARFRVTAAARDINDLIVASMSGCVEPLRAMIDAHDRFFGEGSGEAFFMGPYLDVLPVAVTKQVKGGLEQKMAP
jgi:hypothetical protein